MAQKSIIIIGAGLAGLSAGCYAQMNGYKTRIFEMHTIPGGLCTSWKRKGFTFDGCIHWLMGSRSGIWHRFYEELGAVKNRPMIDHEEFLHVEGAEGKTWIVYSDIDRLEQHMKELAPSDAAVVEDLCKAARSLTLHDLPVEKPMELMGPLDMIKMLKKMSMMRTIRQVSKISIQEYATRFSDPFLRENFPLIMDDMPNFSLLGVLSALANLHMRNAGWPLGGSLDFARAVEKRYSGLGGEIQYKASVEKILVEGDRAVGIRLADGSEHRADIVISAADGHSTIFDMLEAKYIDDEIRSYYDKWPVYEPFIQISLGVDRDFSGEPNSINYPVDEPVNIGGETRQRLHMRHFCYDPALAPEGKSVLTVSFLNTNYTHWKKLYEDSENYKSEKEKLADDVIDRLEKRFPGLKEQIEVVDVATPVTYERYTGNWKGSYMGWMSSAEMADKVMKRTLPGLSSFYMAGQWVYPGGGIPGAVTSGRHVMQVICKKDKKSFTTVVS